MPIRDAKCPENTSGKYFVDKQCIGCIFCVIKAPSNFKMNYDMTHAYVCKQPDSVEEEVQCESVRQACPTDSIGDNGDVSFNPPANTDIFMQQGH